MKRFGICNHCAHKDRPMDDGPSPCRLCGNPAGDYFVEVQPTQPKEGGRDE